MSCENKETNNGFQKEREEFNNKNQKSQENSNANNLRKVEYPERFDFFGNGNQK